MRRWWLNRLPFCRFLQQYPQDALNHSVGASRWPRASTVSAVSPSLTVGGKAYSIHRLAAVEAAHPQAKKLPFSLKILLENLLRNENGLSVRKADIDALALWQPKVEPVTEIAFTPARVLMQDFTGVPCVVDLAAMRDAMKALGGDPAKINPLVPVELVIDHSVQVDEFGTPKAFADNMKLEYERNQERYTFLRWGQNAFRNFKVVPPETGICHQVNLEYLARCVFVDEHGAAYPDTLVGTDSHTTMINGLGVLGWGVGGIEAEAAMLGQPVSMLIPQVVGFKLSGKLEEGATATDLVLTVTQMLRKKGVVGKFVEFFGPASRNLPLADRATIANMAPEYGATCGIFPVDAETLRYLTQTGRPEELVALVEAYYKEQGLFHDANTPEAAYTDTLELDLATVEPSLAGPSRPQDRVALTDVKKSFAEALPKLKAAAKGRSRRGHSAARCRRRTEPGCRGVRRGSRRGIWRQGRAGSTRRRPHGWLGRHRRDHELHEHVEPVGDDRGRRAGEEGRRARD